MQRENRKREHMRGELSILSELQTELTLNIGGSEK